MTEDELREIKNVPSNGSKNCQFCQHFLLFPGFMATGTCHRYPPVATKNTFLFPKVDIKNYCGEFQWKDYGDEV